MGADELAAAEGGGKGLRCGACEEVGCTNVERASEDYSYRKWRVHMDYIIKNNVDLPSGKSRLGVSYFLHISW